MRRKTNKNEKKNRLHLLTAVVGNGRAWFTQSKKIIGISYTHPKGKISKFILLYIFIFLKYYKPVEILSNLVIHHR